MPLNMKIKKPLFFQITLQLYQEILAKKQIPSLKSVYLTVFQCLLKNQIKNTLIFNYEQITYHTLNILKNETDPDLKRTLKSIL